MQQIPDHPAIRRAERTGYPQMTRVFTTCDWCGEEIMDGDEYYEIHGEILCCACVEDCLRKAEVD